MSTIDLHGHRKASALQMLANELERRKTTTTLSVITGTGQHSNGGGAVLRPAVQTFLDQRGFRYKYKSAFGIFEVAVGSGELRAFQKSCAASSKLIVEGDERPKIPQRITKKKMKVAPTTQAKKFTGLPNGPQEMWPEMKKRKGKAPTLLDELKQEKEQVEKGTQASLEEFESEQAILQKEQDAINRALELSSGDEDGELCKILELSIAENAKISKEREAYEEFLRSVVDESTQEATENEEEDEMLLKALEFSSRETSRDDDVLEAVLKASVLESSSVSEADLLRQAIEASVRELSMYPQTSVAE